MDPLLSITLVVPTGLAIFFGIVVIVSFGRWLLP